MAPMIAERCLSLGQLYFFILSSFLFFFIVVVSAVWPERKFSKKTLFHFSH